MLNRILTTTTLCITTLTTPATAQIELQGPTGYAPPIAKASNEGQKAIRRFQKPDDMEITLFAAEPMLANPVAFTIDYQGNFYVAETFRHFKGVSDMRGHQSWLVEDLANRTIEERLITMERNLGDDFASYSGDSDRIRQISDTNGDGIADKATIFADGFDETLAGIGAGVLLDRGELYYTCIPDLWKLTDNDNDGHADQRESLSRGYGVHINFLGHDSHGLRKGPDGRIYFSIGDRGFKVTTKEGTILDYPDTGAVLRCFPDGTGLEVVHQGLRNPQELAFDAYGNLFTGDNNSDGGDEARWVYIVDGGDSGWRIGWQWIEEPNPRGPWNSEKMWHPYHEGQPAHIVPPIANIAAGPSGLTYYPGTGLPDRYDNYFFLADFRGDPNGSLIHAIQVEEDGAGFKIADRHDFVKQMLVTDIDFGIEGGLYATDWVAGWATPQKGRIYRIAEPGVENRPEVQDTKKLLAQGMTQRSADELLALMSHIDMRVRSEAQYALANLGENAVPTFQQAINSENQFTRLHGVWGLWQLLLARDIEGSNIINASELIPHLSHKDPRVRGQAARALGEAKGGAGQAELIKLLSDTEPRPRFFAAIALSKQQVTTPQSHQAIINAAVKMIAENNNRDPYLRHAGVMALTSAHNHETSMTSYAPGSNYVEELAKHENKSIRLAAILALRQIDITATISFLNDEDPFIVEEVIRALHDFNFHHYKGALRGPDPKYDFFQYATDTNNIPWDNPAIARRVINTLYYKGDTASAEALAQYATNPDIPQAIRLEAINDLIQWENPPALDNVNGMWRPIEPRKLELTPELQLNFFKKAIRSDSLPIQLAAIEFAQTYTLKSADTMLLLIITDSKMDTTLRIAALNTLATLEPPLMPTAIPKAIKSQSPLLRVAGLGHLAKSDPSAAIPMLTEALTTGDIPPRQAAFKVLGTINDPQAETLLLTWMEHLAKDEVPLPLQVDLIDAAQASPSPTVQKAIADYRAAFTDPKSLDPYLPALEGGDTERGRTIFHEKIETQCMRCHSVEEVHGSEVGPDLTGLGSRLDRRHILEAIALPNATIAQGFQNVMIILQSGDDFAGRVIKDDKDTLILELDTNEMTRLITSTNPHSIVDVIAEDNPQARTQVSFNQSDIDDRYEDVSSMPSDLVNFLSLYELRDLVEFLTAQK